MEAIGRRASTGWQLIPRTSSAFDERGEKRDAAAAPATIEWRGASLDVALVNVSTSGAMVACDEIPHIGEAIMLRLADRAPGTGVVTWVRDGRIGIHFAAPLK